MLRFAFFSIVALSVISCSVVHTVEIQTLNTAAITFPTEVNTVLIVNNTAQQPSCEGHNYVRTGGTGTDAKFASLCVSSDSLAYDFCHALGRSIAESPVFDDVRICTDTLRYDSANTFATHFTKADVRVLCDRYGVEGIIALDKFSCRTRYEEANGYAYQRGDYINVIIDLELRAMWEGQLTPASIELADTLRWHYAYDWYMMDGYRRERLINIKRAMHRLADYMGHNAQGNFVPWWTNSHRHYYIAYSSVWRRATAYADAERWNEAEEVWNYLLANTKNGLKKAKLLSNIALCLEIKGDIKSALTNAERSYTLFRENKGEEYMLTKAQKQYVETIKGRLANEEILVRQLHEE